MAEEPREVQPGSRIGPLAFTGDDIELGEVIGSGAQAKVYDCTRVRSGEQLAVKVIDWRGLRLLAENPDDVARRLENEVSILRDAKHEHCLGLYDIYRTKRYIFLVMEKLSGGELFDEIIKKKHFNEFEARHVFRQVLDGIRFLHSKQIVHRDLKPENILIKSKSQAEAPNDASTLFEIKIVDFGLSRFTGGDAEMKSVVGTPQYWAPEVLSGGAYDVRVDVWSLGVLLYVMLRGQYPFKGNPETLRAQITSGTYDMTHKHWSTVSEEAKDLVRALLRVNPDERLTLDAVSKHAWVRDPSQADASTDGIIEVVTPQVGGVAVTTVDANVIGDAFDFKKLIRCQFTLAISLEKACLLTRHSHPELSAKIRHVLDKSLALSEEALNVIATYARVARDVRTRVLPDLDLAVKEAEPSLGVDLLDIVHSWMEAMKKDGDNMQRTCADLGRQIQDLVSTAQRERISGMEATDYSDAIRRLQQIGFAPAPRALPGPTSDLLQNLDGLADRAAMTDTDDLVDVEHCKEELVNLLFMAPYQTRPRQITNVTAGPMIHEVVTPGTSTSGTPGTRKDTTTSGGTVVPMAVDSNPSAGPKSLEPASAADPVVNAVSTQDQVSSCSQISAHELAICPSPLVREIRTQANSGDASPGMQLVNAMQELRRVTEILQSSCTFWTHLDQTVQELSRIRDHTQALLKYAAKNPRLKARFDRGLAEYDAYWGSLAENCDRYRVEAQPALDSMRKSINQAENAADFMDSMTLRPATTLAAIAD